MADNELLSLREAAARLGISYVRFAGIYKEERVPHMRFGGSPVFKASDIDAYRAQRAPRRVAHGYAP
jgi:hypothetical protein